MKNKIWLKLFVFVFFISILSSPSHAFYKKKVLVGQFQNPANWDQPYHPGNIVSEVLIQELMGHKRIQLISFSEHMMRLMENSTPSANESYVEPAIFDSEKMSFNGKSGLSSINFALNSLKHNIDLFVSKKLDSLLLEGEVIAFKRKEIIGKKSKSSN